MRRKEGGRKKGGRKEGREGGGSEGRKEGGRNSDFIRRNLKRGAKCDLCHSQKQCCIYMCKLKCVE